MSLDMPFFSTGTSAVIHHVYEF